MLCGTEGNHAVARTCWKVGRIAAYWCQLGSAPAPTLVSSMEKCIIFSFCMQMTGQWWCAFELIHTMNTNDGVSVAANWPPTYTNDFCFIFTFKLNGTYWFADDVSVWKVISYIRQTNWHRVKRSTCTLPSVLEMTHIQFTHCLWHHCTLAPFITLNSLHKLKDKHFTTHAAKVVLLSVASVCGCVFLFVCRRDNSSTVTAINMKFLQKKIWSKAWTSSTILHSDALRHAGGNLTFLTS